MLQDVADWSAQQSRILSNIIVTYVMA